VMFRSLVLVIATMTACARGSSRDGTYSLVLIGARTPATVAADTTDCFIPVTSQLRLADNTWSRRDSIPLPQRCLDQVALEAQKDLKSVSADSGHFVLRGDTLDIFVADTTVGERGLINRGFFRGDTLLFLGTDVEPGDWFYLRSR
jgi:hypothetical protein